MEKVTSIALKRRVLVAGAIAVAVAVVGTKVLADDAIDIEQFYSVNSFVQWDNTAGDYPVITEVGSMPVTLGGHTYTGWSLFAEDATGGLDIFTSAATVSNLNAHGNATGTSFSAGDKLNVGAQWGPFHQIPEISLNPAFLGTPTNNYINTISTGNAVGPRPVFTVNNMTSTGTQPGTNYAMAGFYIEVDNVTITATNGLTSLPGYVGNVAPTIAQETFTMTDNTGSMTMFDWVTSYSAADMLAGASIGPGFSYNMKGFVSYNTGGPLEFTPLSLQEVSVPEPSSVALIGLGVAGLVAMRRRRK